MVEFQVVGCVFCKDEAVFDKEEVVAVGAVGEVDFVPCFWNDLLTRWIDECKGLGGIL